MKYICTLPNLTTLDKKFNIQPFVTDKKDTCYTHTIGILKGQIRVRDNKIIKNTYQEDKTLQELRKIPGIIEHYITQCIDDQLEAMVLICVPYTPETSSLLIPTCYQEAKYAHIKIEITLIDDTLTRVFTIGLHNRNLDIIGLMHDTFD